MAQMEENLSGVNKGDMRLILHKLELSRIRYILASYLRCRIEKIQKFGFSLLAASGESPLSAQELEFAKSYTSGVSAHMTSVAIRHMPAVADIQKTPSDKCSVQPNLDSY